MSYHRVIPRDCFNEANFLNCIGRLYLGIEMYEHVNVLRFPGSEHTYFGLYQNESGDLLCSDIALSRRGQMFYFERPLNSRAPFPLLVILPEDERLEVFSEDGSLSDDFIAFIKEG